MRLDPVEILACTFQSQTVQRNKARSRTDAHETGRRGRGRRGEGCSAAGERHLRPDNKRRTGNSIDGIGFQADADELVRVGRARRVDQTLKHGDAPRGVIDCAHSLSDWLLDKGVGRNGIVEDETRTGLRSGECRHFTAHGQNRGSGSCRVVDRRGYSADRCGSTDPDMESPRNRAAGHGKRDRVGKTGHAVRAHLEDGG